MRRYWRRQFRRILEPEELRLDEEKEWLMGLVYGKSKKKRNKKGVMWTDGLATKAYRFRENWQCVCTVIFFLDVIEPILSGMVWGSVTLRQSTTSLAESMHATTLDDHGVRGNAMQRSKQNVFQIWVVQAEVFDARNQFRHPSSMRRHFWSAFVFSIL